VTDREVQAISQFLREFGYLGCFDIAQRRADRDITKMSEEQVAQKVLDIREAWTRRGPALRGGTDGPSLPRGSL